MLKTISLPSMRPHAGHGKLVYRADGNQGLAPQLFVLQQADTRIKRQQVFGNIDEVNVFVIMQLADEHDGKDFAEAARAIVFFNGTAQRVGIFVGGGAFGQVIGGYKNVRRCRELRQAGIQQRKYFVAKFAVAAETGIAQRLAHIAGVGDAGRQKQKVFGRAGAFGLRAKRTMAPSI